MATITVTADANLATLGHAAGDDIVITPATGTSATLTCNADPGALPAIRSIRSTSTRASFVMRNSATAFSAGNLWKLNFENPGSAAANSISVSGGATFSVEGEWLECYTATGVANETVLNASNVLGVDIDCPRAIQAETAVGSGVFKLVPVFVIGGVGNGYCATTTKAQFGTGTVGRCLFYDHTTRLLTTGDGTNGTLFTSGIKFRIPNILIYIPPFTMTVAVAGWTTATGSQPVVSSTNAPLAGGGSVFTYLVGSEVITVQSLPSGTAVNCNNRALDGTTAVAHGSGTVLYALPNRNISMAGRVLGQSAGNFVLRNCWFGRWWAIYMSTHLAFDVENCVLEGAINGMEITSTSGMTRFVNSAVYSAPGRPGQQGLLLSQLLGETDCTGLMCVGTASTVGTNGYSAQNYIFQGATVTNIIGFDNVRWWRGGVPAGVTYSNSLNLGFPQTCTFTTGQVSGVEIVGGLNFLLQDCSDVEISGLRYSSTNGANNTTTTDRMMVISSNAAVSNVVVRDFDVVSGGLAPYDSWFNIGTQASDVIVHNKVGGAIQVVDCQARTRSFLTVNGKGHTIASTQLSNMRANSQVIVTTGTGSDITLRALTWSEVAGAAVDGTSINGSRKLVLDFPGGPLNGNNGNAGQISNQPDCQAIYACPNTWPSLLGGIYIGPVSAEDDLDIYEFTGGAYQSNTGLLYIETNGDTAIIKATSPVTGVASMPGTNPTYYGTSPSTGLTYQFRLCNWGDDITVVAWGTFDGTTVQTAFNALTGYDEYVGLNVQLKITATTTVSGRLLNQCFIPAQMSTTYNPYVGSVPLAVTGGVNGALVRWYYGSVLTSPIDSATIAASEASIEAGYDYDGTTPTYRVLARLAGYESIDLTSTYGIDGISVPIAMAAVIGYSASAVSGVSFNNGTETVTVTSNNTVAQIWSEWQRHRALSANFDVADTWTYDGTTLFLDDWDIVITNCTITGTATTTGTATFNGTGAWAGGVLTASNGTTGLLTITGAASANVAIFDNTTALVTTAAGIASPYTYGPAFGSTGTWSYRLRRYAYLEASGSFGATGETDAIESLVVDTGTAVIEATAAAYTGFSPNAGTKIVTVTAARTAQELHDYMAWWIVQTAQATVTDEFSFSSGVLQMGTWVVAFSGAGAITGSYTDANGTRSTISAPNLPTGARVQFYNVTGSSEISNAVLASPGATTSLYFTSTPTIRLRASKLGELPIESFGVLTTSGLTFIDEFVTDTVYVAKGIDGSTVTEFTADEPNVQIDSNDPDGVSSVWRAYAWWRYYETLSLGIAGVLFGQAEAVDTENLAISSTIQLDNIHATPLKMNDGYMYRTDGVTIIASASGSIQMDPKKAYGVGSFDVQAAAAAAITAAQPIQADVRRVNNIAVDGTGTDADPWGPV